MTASLTFAELVAKSRSRRDRWHTPDTEPWTGADWSNALCGEAGEAANVVKKLRRHETVVSPPEGRMQVRNVLVPVEDLDHVIAAIQ